MPDDGAKSALLESIASRLRVGGYFAIVDLYGDPDSEEFERLMAGWREYMLIRGMSLKEREVFLRRLGEAMYYVPISRMEELLLGAGFEQLTQFYRAFLYGGWVARRAAWARP